MLVVDGSFGEGGGQILRTSLTVAAATGTPVRISRIRAGRRRAGLRRQHLAAVEAAVAICGARVQGATLGSQELEFHPGRVRGGEWCFRVGSAGSACLVLQTVLLPLLTAPDQSLGHSLKDPRCREHGPCACPAGPGPTMVFDAFAGSGLGWLA